MIKLTRTDGKEVWIAAAHIVSMQSNESFTVIRSYGNGWWEIIETPEEIMKLWRME